MKKSLALLLALTLCCTLSACWEAENEADAAQDFWEVDSGTRETPAEEAKITAFALPYLNTQTLDPIACSDGVQQVVGSLLYEGLFSLDGQFVPHPLLCASYSLSRNSLTYTFALREGVAFSNGASLTASDVLATYRRAQASERYAARFANVASMRVNRGSFVVTLKQPDSGFPALLDIPIVKSGTEKSAIPLGTGPYLFLTDSEGPCLVRNGNWWNGVQDSLPRIALVPAKDADTAIYFFSAYNAHLLAADLLGETPASSLSGVDMADAETSILLFLGFNTKSAPLADSALRRAMGAAFDREAIVTTLLAGHASPAQFPLSPASPLYPAALEAAYESDAYGQALAALVPEGTEPGPLELTLLVNEENPFKVALAEYLAKQLSAAQISVTPAVLPWADYLAALENGGFDLWLGETRLTADWNVTALVGSDGPLNYGRCGDAATDAALKAFLADENAETASALCARLAEEAPILPIVFKRVSVLTPEGLVDGVSPTASQPLNGLDRWVFHLPEIE